MIRIAVCIIFVFSFVSIGSSSFAGEITAGKDLSIKGTSEKPVTLEVPSLQSRRGNVTELHPYSADVSGLKNELEIYRTVYFTLMTAVVSCLIWGVNAKH